MGPRVDSYPLIAQQFLRALRGARSQRAIARKLGYAGNPITDWEHGRRVPTIGETLRAARLLGVDVAASFARFHPAPLIQSRSGFEVAEWMDAVRGATKTAAIAQRSGISRFAIARWLRGEAEPRLHDFFRYVDATTARLYDWVAAFVEIGQVPALRPRYETAVAVRGAAVDAPWSEAVLRAIETPRYRSLQQHVRGALADILSVSVEVEAAALDALQAAGVVRMREGRLECVDSAAVDMRGDPQRVTRLLRHWSGVATSHIAERSETDDLFAYSVSSLSTEDVGRAKEILRNAFREIRSLVKASEPTERVMLVNLQLVLLDQRAPRATTKSR